MTYAEAIHDALRVALKLDPSVIVYGLGTTDPKGIFGTTLGLHEEFGTDRVFDMPTSENAMTGIGVGAAIGGQRPVLSHQRLDFALLSMDQIINNAAKWRFMFGGQRSIPLTIRMVLGRGWGQGPTHSQNLQSIFAHIPGLCVVMPSTPADAKGLLLSSIFGSDPVIFLEHRWLHNMKGDVPEGDHRVKIGSGRLIRTGKAATIVSMSLMTIEALRAVDHLQKQGLECDVIDLRSVRPIDWRQIEESVAQTGRLLVVDSGNLTGSISAEIVARITSTRWSALRAAPQRLAMPDFPEATSPALTKDYHVNAAKIAEAICHLTGQLKDFSGLVADKNFPHDVPGEWFKGPF